MCAQTRRNPSARFVLSAHSLAQVPRDGKPQIVFGGRSNVGKSTLINTLLGQRRLAKTSSTPGRTQALNFFEVDNKYYFVDLPGYGFAKAPLAIKEQWGKLVDSYLSGEEAIAGAVILLDCRREPNQDDRELIEWLNDAKLPFVICLTKADKLTRHQLHQTRQRIHHHFAVDIIPFSATLGLGKNDLWRWIHSLLGR